MFHILICDDDEKYIEYLINLFLKEGLSREESLFYRFTSGEELVASLEKQGECDLLILDMQMKDYDGHKTARLFRNYFPNSVLVFCSGVRKPTDESFKTMPFRYLMKDYSEIKMCSEIRDIIKRVKERKNGIKINEKYSNNRILVDPDEVLYIENYRYGSILHMYNKEIKEQLTSEKKLPELMNILASNGYAYAHNSYIVNLKYVVRLSSDGVIKLVSGEMLNVSRSKLSTFKKSFSEWLSRKYE